VSQLPYFDVLLEKFRQNTPDLEQAFGLNVHWGYWDDPSRAKGTFADFQVAGKRMTRRVYEQAGLKNGMRVLDVGCGFGGTIYEINENLSGMDLVGINIDPRQLERARTLVKPKNGNRVSFVEGDACALPFDAGSFDAVLAVECIFHFPSRARFFAGARKVLKPQGSLTVSDYVPLGVKLPQIVWTAIPARKSFVEVYGKSNGFITQSGYRWIARRSGFSQIRVEDITTNTLPTYDILDKMAAEFSSDAISLRAQTLANGFLRKTSERGWLRYLVLGFS
jgi:ubiquinone/menaquinone biosynthesis C-methylase UbiE